MGAIGTIMNGSGLKQLFGTIYAENTVETIMSGHAYSRAVRAHLLANLVLGGMVLDEKQLTEQERNDLETTVNESERSSVLTAVEGEQFKVFVTKFRTALQKLDENGRTAKLWVQYFRMTTLIRLFIKAERMGDWNLHVITVGKILPFFHAAGHFFNAKSAHLYLQDMLTLEEKMDPAEYQRFTSQGDFAVRHSDKLFAGIWSDMTIEQTLMKSVESYGGLTPVSYTHLFMVLF